MRLLTNHAVAGSDNQLNIAVTDAPGSGGAHHRYEITGFNGGGNASRINSDPIETMVILFQNGPIPANGVNGLTIEALLAIAADRLECFQAGPFASGDNQEALEHISAAMEALHRRTKRRIANDIEGKEVVDPVDVLTMQPKPPSVEITVEANARSVGQTFLAHTLARFLQRHGFSNVSLTSCRGLDHFQLDSITQLPLVKDISMEQLQERAAIPIHIDDVDKESTHRQTHKL